jgi:hypothetical protein
MVEQNPASAETQDFVKLSVGDGNVEAKELGLQDVLPRRSLLGTVWKSEDDDNSPRLSSFSIHTVVASNFVMSFCTFHKR